MKALKSCLLVAAASMALSACGGGAEEPAADAPADAAAPAAVAEAPPADSIDTIDGTTLASFTPDVANGETVYMQCQSCHSLEPGDNRIGPSQHAMIGRAAGVVEGYEYTAANANSGIVWTPEKMFQYLENPQRVIPGTKMAFAGLSSGQDRADVIAYLATIN